MAKRKSKDDFDLGIDLASIKKSEIADDKTVDKAVERVANTDGKPVTSAKPAQKSATEQKNEPAPKKATAKKKPATKNELQLVPKKRLTVDIPYYMNEALRDYTYKQRMTIKEVIHDCLHKTLKITPPKEKK